MKKFTVRRSKWLRGGDNACLLDDNGNMCCLGFGVNQICRVPKKDLLHELRPYFVLDRDTPFTHSEGEDRHFIDKVVEINDSRDISDSVREKRLTKLFKENGIKVTFKD